MTLMRPWSARPTTAKKCASRSETKAPCRSYRTAAGLASAPSDLRLGRQWANIHGKSAVIRGTPVEIVAARALSTGDGRYSSRGPSSPLDGDGDEFSPAAGGLQSCFDGLAVVFMVLSAFMRFGSSGRYDA